MFSRISPKFWEINYKNYLSCPEIIFLAAYEKKSNELAGFVIATTSFPRTYKTFFRPNILFKNVLFILLMVLKNPTKVLDIINVLLTKKFTQGVPEQRWLTWIVLPKFRKNGVGSALYFQLCKRMKEKGVRKFYGTVDCKNTKSNRAHVKFRARKVSSLLIENVPHFLWEHDSKGSG